MSILYRFSALMFFGLLLVGCESGSTGDDDDTNSEIDTESDKSGSTDTDDVGTDTWDARFDEFAKALQADLEKSDAYGISAAVMEGGEIVFAQAFGSKDKDGKEPLTPNTLMQIGSTTKQMTAAAFLRKVEKGLVSVDDTLEDAMPELEFALNGDWDDQITIHHLLSHQSGIADSTQLADLPDDSVLASYMFESFDEEQYLMSPPGAFYNYSNPNFNIIGLLTEQLDTRPWPDIMTEDLFLPLGMDRTFVRKAEVEADGDYSLSFGSGDDGEEIGDVPMADQKDFAWMRPAGASTWTTPSQMMLWANFIMRGNSGILSDELRGEITAEQTPMFPNLDEYNYGYGMAVNHGFMLENGEWYETPVWMHAGGTYSFEHEFYMLPEFDLAFSICVSGAGEDLTHSVSTAFATLLDLPDPSSQPIFEVDPSKFDNHVGVYNDPWFIQGDIIVTRDGDKLLVEIPTLSDQGYNVQSELVAVTSDFFKIIVDDAPNEFTFIAAEKDGPSTYIRNSNFVAVRVEETETAAMRK